MCFIGSNSYNLLRKKVSNKCIEIYIYHKSFSGRRDLSRLGTILSKVSLFCTVIALHKCYILLSTILRLLLLRNTILRLRVLRSMMTFLGPLATKGLLPLGSLPLETNATLEGPSDFCRSSSILRCFEITLKAFMLLLCVIMNKKLCQSLISGRTGITFRSCSSSSTSWLAALRSQTMPLTIPTCSVIGRRESSL